MSDKAAALQRADHPALFPATITDIDHAKLIPYLLADNSPAPGAALPVPDKPTPSAVDYFIGNRPQKSMSRAGLDEMAGSDDRYIAPTAKYLRDNFQSVALLGDDGAEQTDLSDNDLAILSTLLKVDASLREAKAAAHELKVHFKEIDANGNGNLTLDEVGDYAKAHRPNFESVFAATQAQFSTIAHADFDDTGISWTDAVNVANGDAMHYYMHDAYFKQQVHQDTWWVKYAGGAIGAGVGYVLTREGTWGQQVGATVAGSVGTGLVADNLAGMVAGHRIENYYQSTAVNAVNKLFGGQGG